jgi:trehalose 6-phosphate synthase
MNLVAKEYVARRTDGDGALILSEFTGAARELNDALLVNPYDVDQIAESVRQALSMPEFERRKRMQKMRVAVANNNIYRWAGKAISALLRFDVAQPGQFGIGGEDRVVAAAG